MIIFPSINLLNSATTIYALNSNKHFMIQIQKSINFQSIFSVNNDLDFNPSCHMASKDLENSERSNILLML